MTAPYWSDGQITLHLGDCLDVLAGMEDASVDAVATDPPYDLTAGKKGGTGAASLNLASPAGRSRISTGGGGFMGKNWDATGVAFDPATWRSVLRVLKPGGYLLAFGGTRTWHRLVCAVEDAGFEIRDSVPDLVGQDAPGLMWIYGSGFPKSQNAGRAIDVHVCALPGRHYPNQVLGDPRPGDHVCPESEQGNPWRGHGTAAKPAWEPIVVARKPLAGTLAANLLRYGTGALNIDGCRVEHGADVDMSRQQRQQQGEDNGWRIARSKVGSEIPTYKPGGRWPPNVLLGPAAAAELDRQSGSGVSRIGKPRASAEPGDGYGMTHTGAEYADSGGASRFFPVFRYEAKAATSERQRGDDGSAHPTVKPVDLMSWLVRLVTPPGGTVLDPFAGSGTTAEACIVEGFKCVLIEREPAYAELIRTRLRKDIQPAMFGEAG